MPESIVITPITSPVEATVRPPGSKSLTNRALVCAALAKGNSTLTGALVSDDTRVMIDSLAQLGLSISIEDQGQTLQVAGTGGTIPTSEADLFVGNSGTTIRFLTAMASLGQGRYRLDGVPRMRERPIGDLLDALRSLGAQAETELDPLCPPVVVGGGLPGGTATVRGDISSQFLSGLLMVAPNAEGPVTLQVDGPLVSQPYVRMTLRVMEAFGVKIDATNSLDRFSTPGNTRYVGQEYAIEPDASAASYFWAAAAITGGTVTVEGLDKSSLQGDVALVDLFAQMGCQVTSQAGSTTVKGGPLRGIRTNMNAISDMVQTLAVVALFAEGPTEITGVAHNRHKETDRIAALATELRKLGAKVDEREDGLRIDPPRQGPPPLQGATIETYDDHRMAMSLALAGLKIPNVKILHPACTAKTYPNFFSDFAQATGAHCQRVQG